MLQAEKCQVCIKTQKHTTVYARKVYNVQLHPELFDWHVVGPNIWKIETLKSNLNYMMHNETFHVTLRKVSGYRLLFKTLTDLTPFTPLKELLQDPAHAKQIRRVIASLTQVTILMFSFVIIFFFFNLFFRKTICNWFFFV